MLNWLNITKRIIKIMALPYATPSQLALLEEKIRILDERLAEVEKKVSQPQKQQKIVVGENSDGTVSVSISDK